MLRSANELFGYRMAAADGEIGEARDFLFDDHEWTVRYLVVDTGTWIPGRKVLLVPQALGEPQWDLHVLPTLLEKGQIEKSPEVDCDKPVSRQKEIDLHDYFGWSPYWMPGTLAQPIPPRGVSDTGPDEQKRGDPNLRSARKVKGYRIAASDGDIGHIEDLIVDDSNWVIRYAVIDTRNWLPGKKVVISPHWIKHINWSESKAHTDLTQAEIKNAPEYTASTPINREYETRLYDYYGRPVYW